MSSTSMFKGNYTIFSYEGVTDNNSIVHINDFTSLDGSISYKSLDSSEDSFNSLNSVFSIENINVANYGDGTHADPVRTQKKVDIWGKRGNNEEPLRAFLVEKDSDTLGFVNIGRSVMKDINGNDIYEGGALFNSKYNNSTDVSLSLDAVYNDYFKALHENGFLPGGLFIYTISPENPLYFSLQNSSLNELESNSSHNDCVSEILAANENRFQCTEDHKIIENDREVAVFYNLIDSTICEFAGQNITEDSN